MLTSEIRSQIDQIWNAFRIEPEYLSFFLSLDAGGQRQIAKFQYGQTKPGLNFEQIRRFEVPVPTIQLQREFACRVRAVEKLKTAQRASLAERMRYSPRSSTALSEGSYDL